MSRLKASRNISLLIQTQIREKWYFIGQRTTNIMSLMQSAKLNGHEPHAYLNDVLTRLPTQKASQIHELLPQH